MNNKPSATRQQIADYLQLFDGDVARATQALTAYQSEPKSAHRQSQPLGPVVIDVRNLKKQYKVGRQKVSALDGVSLQIRAGEFEALTGASGSGKSTLLQLIGGLDQPTDGTVVVDGADLSKMRDGRLAEFRSQTIGFVFQFFYLQPFLRLEQNLEVPGMFARTKHANRTGRAATLAKTVGLDERVHHFPRELSGGQMQRAAIARALLNNPKVILADEPTGNLDSENGRTIVKLFEHIRTTYGTTIIIVTHDRDIAAQADREINLKDGVIA